KCAPSGGEEKCAAVDLHGKDSPHTISDILNFVKLMLVGLPRSKNSSNRPRSLRVRPAPHDPVFPPSSATRVDSPGRTNDRTNPLQRGAADSDRFRKPG